jgi:NCS1 family nucleobase:cation symporter-1
MVADLYRGSGAYYYRKGWNPAALFALAVGVAPNLPGFLNAAFPHAFSGVHELFREIYAYAWFVGLLVAGSVYALIMAGKTGQVGAHVDEVA